MPDQVRHDRIQNLVSTVSVVVGLRKRKNWRCKISMKIALAQINPTVGDFEHNTEKMMGFIEKAKGLSCDLIVFSEMVISGYPPLDLLERRDFVATNLRYLHKLVETVTGIGVICGFVDENPDQEGYPLYNSAVLFDTGKILHRAHKRLLPDYDVYDERMYF